MFLRLWSKLFGSGESGHVCEEFTRWTTREAETVRAPTHEEWMRGNVRTRIKEAVRFQERECTICGKIEQRKIQ